MQIELTQKQIAEICQQAKKDEPGQTIEKDPDQALRDMIEKYLDQGGSLQELVDRAGLQHDAVYRFVKKLTKTMRFNAAVALVNAMGKRLIIE